MKSMSLAPVDYVFTGPMSCPVTFAFSYPKRLDAARVQQSISPLLAAIPWLGGRLRATAEHGYAYALDDHPVTTLEVARSHKSFYELSGSEAVRVVRSADGQPLMHARITHTPNGSVLGVSMSHALVDGFSFFLALSRWAACARGEAIDAPPMRRLLQPSEAQVRAAAEELTPGLLLERSGLFWAEPRPEVRALPQPLSLQLRASQIDALVADAQRHVSVKLRQNDVLTAWLWRTYGSAWWSSEDASDVYMSCPVDVRRLLGAENQNAFGCTICGASVRASSSELRTAPLGELALRIQKGVSAVFADDWGERVAPLEALRRRHGIAATHAVHLRHPQRGMLVTNMSRLPLAELDFGSGAPVGVRLFSEIDAMAAILPARDGVTIDVFGPRSNVVSLPKRSAAGLITAAVAGPAPQAPRSTRR